MRGIKQAFIFFAFIYFGFLQAQNWNVFNKNYRYNYKFDYSSVVSQVLFVDTVMFLGSDTIYNLNLIGVECSGSCLTGTILSWPAQKIILPNMPQFLQRKITKFYYGDVLLSDTANLLIKPKCLPNQTWVFDVLNNKIAKCVSSNSQNKFGLNDSVKLILIGNTDTILLSKNFGILQFPALYNQNKYYRLSGIEKAASYDSIALYGEKVPNAWDFFNFDVGDRFCIKEEYEFMLHNGSHKIGLGDFIIVGKTIQNDAYTYSVDEKSTHLNIYDVSNNLSYYGTNSNAIRTYSNLSGPLFENVIYPGKIYAGGTYNYFSSKISSFYSGTYGYNIIKFGYDNKGRFMKYAGLGCANTDYPYVTSSTIDGLLYHNQGYLIPSDQTSNIYVVGLGKINNKYFVNGKGERYQYCQTCAIKKGQLYYGNENYVGIDEQKFTSDKLKIYPNPTRENVQIELADKNYSKALVLNLLGQVILEKEIDQQEQNFQLNLSLFQNGIYFIQFYKGSHLVCSQKLLKN